MHRPTSYSAASFSCVSLLRRSSMASLSSKVSTTRFLFLELHLVLELAIIKHAILSYTWHGMAWALTSISSRSIQDNPSSRIVEVRISEVPLYNNPVFNRCQLRKCITVVEGGKAFTFRESPRQILSLIKTVHTYQRMLEKS